jgi:DNA-binding GntR family transcriptional regulator
MTRKTPKQRFINFNQKLISQNLVETKTINMFATVNAKPVVARQLALLSFYFPQG